MFLQILALLLLIPAALIALYYMLLATVGLWVRFRTSKMPLEITNLQRFAIIIPAHNEEKTILKTLQSCKAIDYPVDKYSVFVIADNCTDSTEQIVFQNNTDCLVRNNQEQRGKGQALAWAFDKLSENNFDAFIIIDADCIIDAHALKVFNQYLENGNLVLQANDVSSNPDDSAMSYAVSVGNVIENDLFYAAKDILGLAVQLRGTGMVLSKKILDKFPWGAESVVEDMEYSMLLIKNGIKIRFVREAKVSSDFPVNKEQLHIQRTRWAGNLGFGKKDAVKLMIDGARKKSLILFDLGLSFLVLSRPLVLAELFLAVLISYISSIYNQGPFPMILFIISLIVLATQLIYFSLGILLLGINKKRFYYLIETPVIVARLAVISFFGMIQFGKQSWSRTPRDNSGDK